MKFECVKTALAFLTALLLAGSAWAQPEKLPENIDWLTNDSDPVFASPNAKKGGMFRGWMLSFPMTFREVGPDSNGAFANNLRPNQLSLIALHPNTERIIPQLATHWAFGKDRKTMYFRLNKNARWSDGKPVTSRDFIYSLGFYRSKEIVSPFYNHFYTEEIENIIAYDDNTLAVVSTKAVPDLHLQVNLSPVPANFYGKLDKGFVRKFNWKIAPNTGPYRITDFKKGKQVVFKRKKEWWAKDLRYFKNRFNVDTVKLSVIRDTNMAWEYFRKGRLDSFRVTFPNYWHEKSDIPEVKNGYIHRIWFFNDTRRSPQGLYLNADKEIFKDRNARHAFAHAINFDKVLKQVLRNDYFRLNQAYEGYGDYSNKKIRARGFDMEKVTSLLTASGWTRGGDGIWQKEGKRFSVLLTYSSPVHTRRYVVIKEEAKKAGIEIRLEKLDSASSFKKFLEKKHDIAMMAWTTGFRPSYWQSYHSDNAHKPQTNNITNADDPVLDDLIDRYDDSLDAQERMGLSIRIQQVLHDNGYFVPTVKVPYFREAYWRWWRIPEIPGTKNSQGIFDPFGDGLFWFDETLYQETRAARKGKKRLDPVTLVDETYKAN